MKWTEEQRKQPGLARIPDPANLWPSLLSPAGFCILPCFTEALRYLTPSSSYVMIVLLFDGSEKPSCGGISLVWRVSFSHG